jgi:signal transduction histidine kinase
MDPETQTHFQALEDKPAPVSILMVDDEPANLLALEAVLEDLGQRLVRAKSGREALRHLMNEEFAVILLDVAMPVMDGFETARLVRQRDKNRLTPIIFLTAVGRTENEIFRGYEVGAVDYLVKPLVPEILKSKVMIFIELYNKTRHIQKLNIELEKNIQELESANLELKKENAVRRRAEQELRYSEEKLRNLNSSLEQKVAERTALAEERARELSRSNAELQQFVHISSHDLKEPLRMINSFVQLLQRHFENKLDATTEEYLRYVVEGAHRIQRLIDDLLSYTRLGARSISPQSVDVTEVVEEALSNLKLSIEESGAEISCGPMPPVEADRTHLVILFQNLIGNAIKFNGGKKPVVRIQAKAEIDHWVFSVRDNGIGIEPRYFEKIFVVFQRLNAREEYPGTGIGLALCKKIVEQHNGKIWVESEPGNGSAFYFTIPQKVKGG